MRKGSEGISNHIVPKSRDKAKARFAALKEGEEFHNLDNGLKVIMLYRKEHRIVFIYD